MSIQTADCKQAIANEVNNKTAVVDSIIAQFVEKLTSAEVINHAGNPKNWARMSKLRVSYSGRSLDETPLGATCLRIFDCRPFDDQLRAYVWDDGNQILKIEIVGE